MSNFLKNKYIFLISLFGFLLNLLTWIILIWKIKPSVEPIPLHYNIYLGIDLIGNWKLVYILPGSGLIIYFINFIISYIIYKRLKLISYFLISIILVVELIFLNSSYMLIKLYY